MINNLESDSKFIFENPFKSLSFLKINIYFLEKNLIFDIYGKPTNSFNYLTHANCHSPHTKNIILLSLAKRVVIIVTNNRENRLKELKEHLFDRKHQQHIIHCSFKKIFQPKFQTENNNNITFVKTQNLNHIYLKTFHCCLDRIKTNNLKAVFKEGIIIH